MRFGLIAVVLLTLFVVTGCELIPTRSNSGALYKYKGKIWLVIHETGFDEEEPDKSHDRLAIVRPDGKAQFVAMSEAGNNYFVSPEVESDLGGQPIEEVQKNGRFIRIIYGKDINRPGYEFQIRTSLLQDDETEDQDSAPAAQTNTENISTTSSGQSDIDRGD